MDEILQEIEYLKSRVNDLESTNDLRLFTCYMANLNKKDIYYLVETAVADCFNIERELFYDSLLVGNRSGRKGRSVPKEIPPTCEEDRVIIARQCLYGILHVDFHIQVSILAKAYNSNVQNYMDKWKDRYIRVIYGSGNGENDYYYKNYYQSIFKRCVELSHEHGMYDELLDKLSKSSIYFNRLAKWRIEEK